MEDPQKLQNAIKLLRKRIDMTQSELAAAVGKSLGTVQRYETTVPPKGLAWVPLIHIAEDFKFEDLADLFRSQLLPELKAANLGAERDKGLHEKTRTRGVTLSRREIKIERPGPDQEIMEDLISVMDRGSRSAKFAQRLIRVLKRYLEANLAGDLAQEEDISLRFVPFATGPKKKAAGREEGYNEKDKGEQSP